MKKMKYFSHCKSLDEVKSEYKKLTQQWLPTETNPGNKTEMALLDDEYFEISQRPKFKQQSHEVQEEFISFPKIVKELVRLGLNLEVCGSWLWCGGDTIKHKEVLKELGLRYSPGKQLWYYRPKWHRSTNSTPVDMDFIRKKWGTDKQEQDSLFDQPVEANGQGRIKV